jgi:hypothetical protein
MTSGVVWLFAQALAGIHVRFPVPLNDAGLKFMNSALAVFGSISAVMVEV